MRKLDQRPLQSFVFLSFAKELGFESRGAFEALGLQQKGACLIMGS